MSLEFKEILEDPELRKYFHEFCKKRFCDENIKFYEAVEEYKKLDGNKQKESVKEIYNKFVRPECDFQINIDNDVVVDIENGLDNPDQNIFDRANSSVYGLMRQASYPAFLKSNIYKEAIKQNLTEDEYQSKKIAASGMLSKEEREIRKLQRELEEDKEDSCSYEMKMCCVCIVAITLPCVSTKLLDYFEEERN
eukprot:TRINITY_DN159_c0_g1_i1.p1 TRINITY_DN159_c0_g1~~TRINITY_DN159_c0_g1_i1.p1  ORF type:complete len:194 (+),score=60.68 TRINITY_DN159_c0_g1_i1:117-698(+)